MHTQEITIDGKEVTMVYDLSDVDYDGGEPGGYHNPPVPSSVYMISAIVEETGKPATEEQIDACNIDDHFLAGVLEDIEDDLAEWEEEKQAYKADSILEARWGAAS
jgi:hypothetical protein